MFDLLSLAVLNSSILEVSDVVVLNSIAFVKDIEKMIPKYESVHLYLDNDTSGKKATHYLIQTYNHVIDQSSIYKNNKDLNDLLSHENREKV